MRRAFLASLAAAAALSLIPAAPVALAQTRPAASSGITGAERAQLLARASAALNAQRTAQGRFQQVAPDGSVTTGRFYLQRPGRVRFDYDDPAPFLIVADGSVVAMQDRSLRTTNRAPLRSTPLYFVLKNDIDLERDTRITRVTRDGAALLVSARDRRGQADGEITMRLVGPNMELRSWDVVDATGSRTRIALTEIDSSGAIDPSLFRAPASSARSPRGR